jgi:hypothetical protein
MSETDSEFVDRIEYLEDAHYPLREADRDRLIELARRGVIAPHVDSLVAAERNFFREQDEAIRSEFGGKRDGRPTIECLREAFAAKWSEADTLFQATLDMKTEELRAKVQKLESECTDLATDLNTQRQDNASLAEPWKVLNPLRAEVARLSAENEKLRAAITPRPIEEAPKDREVIGVERPPFEDCNYFHMGRWNKEHQKFMADAGYDRDTGAQRWAFCGVTHYIDPQSVPLLPEHIFEDGDIAIEDETRAALQDKSDE